tara:strand:- start:215 stop:382 length:168 start_codon:yes stop_codon:yes gene_type:complete
MKLCISKDEATFIQECIALERYTHRHNRPKSMGESLIFRINKLLTKKESKAWHIK